MNELHVKFPHIEAVEIFPVQIDHVAVGYAARAAWIDELVMIAPDKRFLADKTVVVPVEIADGRAGHVEWETAA